MAVLAITGQSLLASVVPVSLNLFYLCVFTDRSHLQVNRERTFSASETCPFLDIRTMMVPASPHRVLGWISYAMPVPSSYEGMKRVLGALPQWREREYYLGVGFTQEII